MIRRAAAAVWATLWLVLAVGWSVAIRRTVEKRRIEKNRRIAMRAGVSARLAEMEQRRVERQAANEHPTDGDVSIVVYAESEAEAADLIDKYQRAGGLVVTGMMRITKP